MPTKSQISAALTRLDQLRHVMKGAQVDGILVNHPAHLRYLLGFSGSTGMAIVGKRSINFFTNDLYDVQVRKEVYPIPGLNTHITRDFWAAVASSGIGSRLTRVGFVPTATTVATYKAMKKALSPAKVVEVSDLVAPITQSKSKAEIASIAKAADIVSEAYQQMLGMVAAGMTEHEVASFLATTTRALGSSKDAFDIIVVSGPRSAMPHGRASTAVLKKGHVVTVDFGACVDGLHSDMTRTFCIGTPSKQAVDMYAVLFDAHLTALDAVAVGVTGDQLDAAARGVIEKAGFGQYFRHSLGHGLGYDVHELPRVAHGNTTGVIPENCVLTIEPGIYVPGTFGMRIEDDVLVTSKGPVILTSAPRELVIV